MDFDFSQLSMDNDEALNQFMEAVDEEVKLMRNGNYDVDTVQLDKLNDLVEFFTQAAKSLGGKIDSVDLNPAARPNGVTANFLVFDLFDDEVKRFCDVIRECSAVTMDVTESGEISISCTIPGIFIPKA